MAQGGYLNVLLEVDLGTGVISTRPLPGDDVLRTWLGGTGLGLHILCQEIRLEAKATDPDVPVIIMTGPLTGTKAPSSSDWKIITVRPDLWYHPTVTQSHGFFGARLKHAGYDGIIIKGASPEPVYLWIDNDHVEIRDAAKFWGMDIYETQRKIQLEHGDVEGISVACIGPAGENMMIGASVRNDRAYGANKGSSGLVWGSKKLKAIAVRGKNNVPIYDYEKFIQVRDEWRDSLFKLKNDVVWFDAAGGLKAFPALVSLGFIPSKNFTDGAWQVEWGKQFSEDLAKWKVSGVGSWECEWSCHHETLITTGPFAGTKVFGFGPENIEGAATNIGIFDPGTCMAMGGFYDSMGADPCDAGRLIALCFEMYNKGLLSEKDTGGLKLEWGNDEAARELFMKIMYREEPLGAILAKGFKEAVQELGRGAEDMLAHIKWVGFNDHDIRALIGFLFQSLIAGAGPCWQAWGNELMWEPDFGFSGPVDGGIPDGKAWDTYRSHIKKMWEDSTGICQFVTWGIPGITTILPRAVSYATGFDIDWEEARRIGERIIHLQRLYALSRGFRVEYDRLASARTFEPVPGGPADGHQLLPYLDQILSEYYGYLDWDLSTGRPSQQRLEAIGLADYKIGRA